MEPQRGVIHNLKRYKQLLDFSGMKFKRNITPTDIDAVIDFGKENTWILMEYKTKGNNVPLGQRKCIEADLHSHYSQGKKVLGLICEHSSLPNEMINAANCLVTEYWMRGKWRKPCYQWNVKSFIDKFLTL